MKRICDETCLPKTTDSKWLSDFNLNSINTDSLVSRIELFENYLKIVIYSSVLVRLLCKNLVFFRLTNSWHVYSWSIDDFDDLMCSVESTTDSMYQGVMFVFYTLVLLVQLDQHSVTQSNTRFVKILQSSNHKKFKWFVIAFCGQVISIKCPFIQELAQYSQMSRWNLSRAFISLFQSNE